MQEWTLFIGTANIGNGYTNLIWCWKSWICFWAKAVHPKLANAQSQCPLLCSLACSDSKYPTYTSIYCLTLSMESTSKCFCFKTHFGTCGKSSQRRISQCPAALAWSVPLPALVDGGVGCDSCVQTVWSLGGRSTHLWGYSGHMVGMWWDMGMMWYNDQQDHAGLT